MLISIIVPVYNCEGTIAQCLDSLVVQTHPETEILIVNDGSTDNSLPIIRSYQEKHNNIVLRSTQNSGQGAARNVALKLAKGDFIGFMDADDWAEPDMYGKMLDRALKTNADIIACEFLYFYEDRGKSKRFRFRTKRNDIFGKSAHEEPSLYHAIGNYCPNKLFARHIFKNGPIYFPENQAFEDSWIMPDLLFRARKIEHVKEALFTYRRRVNSSTTTRIDRDRLFDAFLSADKIRTHFEKNRINASEEGHETCINMVALVLFARFELLLYRTIDDAETKNTVIEYIEKTFDYLDTHFENWSTHYTLNVQNPGAPKFLARTSRDQAITLANMSREDFITYDKCQSLRFRKAQKVTANGNSKKKWRLKNTTKKFKKIILRVVKICKGNT